MSHHYVYFNQWDKASELVIQAALSQAIKPWTRLLSPDQVPL